MLEKITELKSVENEVKALSECVGGQAGLKGENSDLTGVSTQKPGQLPGKSPTPDSCKGEGSPRVKNERKPLQKSDKEKVEISNISSDKSEKHGAPGPIKWRRKFQYILGTLCASCTKSPLLRRAECQTWMVTTYFNANMHGLTC